MTERRLVLESGAEAEIEEATVWYEQQRPTLGLELAREVRQVFEQLVRVPNKSLVVPGVAMDLHVRRVFVRNFPYGVVIVETDDAIHVVAFAHLKKKPNYWRKRLRRLLGPAPSSKR
jgi:toxin ParE1/3/4